MSTLTAMFEPRGVAVIGASLDPGKMGSIMVEGLSGFSGPVIGINERLLQTTDGLYPSAEAAVADHGPLDLAALCVPAPICAQALRRAATAGVRAALVCAGGFAEVDAIGAHHQDELLAVAREFGVRLLGPNTSGFIAPARRLRATFVPGAREISAGRVGVVAASGGVNHALAFLLSEAGYGVSLAVGLGNAIDVDACDLLDYLAADPQTHAIALHIESVQDGRRLLDAVRRAATLKPVVALVVGRADVRAFAQSHTGALATAWRTTRSLLTQAGAVIVGDERGLVDAVAVLAQTRLVASNDPQVGLVTAQAGPGLLVLDDLRDHGVALPELAAATQAALGSLLPPMTFQANPVDTGRPSQTFAEVLRVTAADPSIDVVAVYALTEPDAIDLADAVREANCPEVPIVAGLGGPRKEVEPTRDKLIADGHAVLTAPSALATAIRALVTDARHQHRRTFTEPVETVCSEARDYVTTQSKWHEQNAKTLLSLLGVATPQRVSCRSDDDVAQAFQTLAKPVVMKILDADLLHKTELGGVHLGIRDIDQCSSALAELREIGAAEILVEEMAADGVDLIVGALRDPVFGPVVLVGLGGTEAELHADVSLRAAPLHPHEARQMITDLKGAPLLDGWRGGPTLDLDELGRIIATLGAMLAADTPLHEIEINPLRLTRDGLIALDAVVTTRSH